MEFCISPFKFPVRVILEFSFIKSAVKSRIIFLYFLFLFFKFELRLDKSIFFPVARIFKFLLSFHNDILLILRFGVCRFLKKCY